MIIILFNQAYISVKRESSKVMQDQVTIVTAMPIATLQSTQNCCAIHLLLQA